LSATEISNNYNATKGRIDVWNFMILILMLKIM
jgi:hypothetical protein